MKLKKAESEMLPVWVLSGVYTKPFFAWLNEAEKSNIWEHQNDTVVKMRQGNFIYLYLQKGAGKNLVPGHDLKFAGLFVRKNYNLYDVDMELAVLLGLPEEIGFPCRTDIRRAAEERASQKADEILEMHWQEFLFQSGLDTMIDLRYYNENVEEYMKEHQITDVLVLYNITNFISDRNLYKLVGRI